MNSFKAQFDNLPIKKKWTIMIASIFAICLLAFKFNIKETIKEISKFNNTNREYPTSGHAYNTLNKKSQIDSVLNFENNLSVLNYISSLCVDQSIYVNEISQTSNEKRDGLTIETTKLVLSGKYSDILKIIYNIEKETKIARVNSASFSLVKYKSNKEYSLLATIYIKYIRT